MIKVCKLNKSQKKFEHTSPSDLKQFTTPKPHNFFVFNSTMTTGNAAAVAARSPVRAPEKSSFAQTCNLLRQYLKEKRSLEIGITASRIEPKEAPATMNLLTNMENPEEKGVEPPMTIFYGGQVVVFNDLPSEKAEEIMAMAMAGKGMVSCSRSAAVSDKQQPPTKFFKDMPIAGRASLHRFFDKRKNRIAASAPYQVNSHQYSASSSKPATQGYMFNNTNPEERNHFDLNL